MGLIKIAQSRSAALHSVSQINICAGESGVGGQLEELLQRQVSARSATVQAHIHIGPLVSQGHDTRRRLVKNVAGEKRLTEWRAANLYSTRFRCLSDQLLWVS